MKPEPHNEMLECWDPSTRDAFKDVGGEKCPLEAEREGTGLCDESQSDGVPCTDPKRQCERCGRAHR